MQINPGALYDKRGEMKERKLARYAGLEPASINFQAKQAIIKPITLPTELIARSFASGCHYP